MKIPYFFAPLLVTLISCGVPSVRGDLKEEIPPKSSSDFFSNWLVDTEVSATRLVAGDTLDIRCIVTRAGDLLSATQTQVLVTPSLESSSLVEANGTYQFTATQTGPYIFQCQTLDGSIVDEQPPTVEVAAGQAVAVETIVESDLVQAGVPVDVHCQAFDAYGNSIEQQPVGTGLDIDHLFEVHDGLQEQFVVRGTIIGSYSIGCTIGADIVDETPETLVVVPGVAANSNTIVTPEVLYPTQRATITCAYTDLYGNQLSDVPSSISVLPESAEVDSNHWMLSNGNEFSAIKRGRYFVFCSSPGFYAGDETPAEVMVGSGLPYSWNVDMLEQECYWQNRTIPISYTIYDYWGNEVNDALVETTVIPAEGVVIDDAGNILLAREAEYSLILEISSPLHSESHISAYIDFLVVDSTPPQIQIASPKRAVMIQEGGYSEHDITVEGSLTDGLSSIISATLNGETINPEGNASSLHFSKTQKSDWGMSVITARAEDECANAAVHVQSYLRSPHYFPASTAQDDLAQASDAIVAHLNQPVIDDFDRSDPDDMATLGQMVLSGLDLDTLIAPGYPFVTDPINPTSCSFGQFETGTGYFVGRDSDASQSIEIDGPWIESLVANDDGIGFDIRMSDFSFPLEFWYATILCAGLNTGGPTYATFKGEVGASTVKATGTLGVDVDQGGAQVTMDSFNLELDGLSVDLECGILNWFCDGILDLLLPPMTNVIADLLGALIQDQIPGVLEDLLNGFQLGTELDLPEPINMTLNINSLLDSTTFSSGTDGNGYGQLGLAAQVFPSSKGEGISDEAKGAIRKNGSVPDFSATEYAFGLGLKDDLLNQIMWALWYGGGLNIDNLTEFVSESSLEGADEEIGDLISMSIKAELPPVIMQGTGDDEIDIGLGDVWVEASVDLNGLLGGEATEPTITLGMYVSSLLGGSLEIDPVSNEMQILISEDPDVFVQVVEIDDKGYQSLMSELFTRVLKLILPRIFRDVLGSFPLPEFDLSALAGEGIVAPGTVWQLTEPTLERPNSEYFRLTGSLQ